MKPIAYLLPTLLSACAIAGDPESGSVTDDRELSRSCTFIPGCSELIEAQDGPFIASVMTYEHAGATRRRLAVTYSERIGSTFLSCTQSSGNPDISLLFVLGEGSEATSLARPMRVDCVSTWGDHGGHPNTATFSVVEDEQPALWDTLFPPGPGGERWYALQVAAQNAHGEWDSSYGANFHLALE